MRKKGFTLVEIMIVVAIVALLAAIAIPNVLRSRVNANEANAQALLRAISTASENFAAANNSTYPATMATLTGANPPYISVDYTANNPNQGYTIACGTFGTAGYSCTATPTTCNTTGTRTFTIRTGGVLTAAACS